MDKMIIIPVALMIAGMGLTFFLFYGVEYLFNLSDFKELEELEKKLY